MYFNGHGGGVGGNEFLRERLLGLAGLIGLNGGAVLTFRDDMLIQFTKT
jgi:hypothetical protein